ncbi:MAG: hypothetical protein Q7W29_03650 [bacterium]|nr:hypothetical protein [bacterium]
MLDHEDLELQLHETRLVPRPNLEHKEALRAELRARARDRQTSRPLILTAIVMVTLGTTFIDQPALESTGMRLDVTSIIDDGSATFSTREGAAPSFSFGRSNSSVEPAELDSLKLRLEQKRLAYMEGRLSLNVAFGLTFEGMTAYHLVYGEDRDGFYFPVDIGVIEDSERYHRFVRSPRYSEISGLAYQGKLAGATTDTLMLDGHAVAMTSWRLTEPEFGAIVFHSGTPLN